MPNNTYKSDTKELNFIEVTTDKKLYEQLNAKRQELANKERVLPSMIISKNSLKEISGRYPTNKKQLKDITGFGPVKVDKYGDDFLEIVLDYIKDKEISTSWIEKKKLKVIIDGDSRSNEEIAIDMIKDNNELDYISKEIEVSISTILGYITDMIKSGKEIDFKVNLNKYYNDDEKNMILSICEEEGIDKVSNIKKKLPDNIKYETIRAVILENYYCIK